jgi:hypothetical protein
MLNSQHFKIFGPWILVIVLVLAGLSAGRQILKKYSIEAEADALKAQIASNDQKNAELANLLQYIQSSAYTEEQARLKFGYAKPGEKLAIVPNGAVLGTTTDAADSESEDDQTNFAKWWGYFFQP